jgi:NADH-quinone oxidoreductase subunit G
MTNVIYIDGIKLLVSTSHYKTIFQVCNLVGKNIPHFCFNKKLAIAGNCRICLVEVAGLPKPIASCANPVTENMAIFTKSPLVLKARENVMEFLLANHPLDCPICSQAGECDLQELSLSEGREMSRFFLQKRAVSDKNISSMIHTHMTRCIHCTKCVRLSFLMGTATMGVASRGNRAEIFDYTYVSSKHSNRVNQVLMSNIVDICPVGWSC